MVQLSHAPRRTEDRSGEHGAILVMSAILMVAMMTLTALAVDIAHGRAERRRAQNTADAAALAAGRDLPDTAAAITTAKSYVAQNTSLPANAWVGCQDSGHLAAMPDTANNDQCISFSSDSKQVRVRVPIRNVSTFFGGVVGVKTMPVRAAATAAAILSRADRIVPAAVSGLQGTGLICVEQSGTNTACSTRQRGQFGSLQSPRMNFFKPSSNTGQNTLGINYAMNLDHSIQAYSSGAVVCDGQVLSPCSTTNIGTSLTANAVLTSSGNDIPPVTEGYVTGFSASTTDAGQVTFCGRLQRPDFTATNATNPSPGNCNTPGAPTTTILGKTVNGRHVYYWLNDRARQLFYPEVWSLGYADTDQRLAIGNTVFTNGNKRLDCFLAGYRWNTSTKTETLPNCTSVGLTYPGSTSVPFSHTVRDSFATTSYSNNNGDTNWLSSWAESGDDNNPATGTITISSGSLWLGTSAAGNGDSLTRSVNMTDPATGALASSATLTATYSGTKSPKGQVSLQISTDGTTWTSLGSVGKGSALATASVDVSSYISTNTRYRMIVTSTGGGGDQVEVSDLSIAYSGSVPGGSATQVAPIFKQGMSDDPRWAVIPLVSSTGSTNQAIPISGFWAFYGYTSYVTNSKVAAFDAWVFDPALMLDDPTTSSFSFGFSPNSTVRLIH
ncbi:MAG: sodium:calcium exchanger [Acidimicrobiales bacterium]|nr:sodium:calcium exchanger [Acidimicrobiales bacterium]